MKMTGHTKHSWPFMERARKPGEAGTPWSQRVTKVSNALDLEAGVFTWDDPRAIAQSLKDSADMSERRKASAFQSAMSMLSFYINRAGNQLSAEQRAVLEAAKDELRALYGRVRHEESPVAPPAPGFVERRSSTPAS